MQMDTASLLVAGRTNPRPKSKDEKYDTLVDGEILVRRDRFDGPALKRIIRDMGLKVTEQRVAILESLARGRVHVTAQEVYEKIRKSHPEIGFATVYRFLRDLSNKKFVTEVRMGGLPARYELTP